MFNIILKHRLLLSFCKEEFWNPVAYANFLEPRSSCFQSACFCERTSLAAQQIKRQYKQVIV